jgi:tRNA-binding protein
MDQATDTPSTLGFDDFLKVDIRVGRVVRVEDFPEARKPAWKLTIDFGEEIGTKRSSAQITNYGREELQGRLVVAVVNFPPRRIGPFSSEVLVLGASDQEGRVILLAPDAEVPLGASGRAPAWAPASARGRPAARQPAAG